MRSLLCPYLLDHSLIILGNLAFRQFLCPHEIGNVLIAELEDHGGSA